MEQLKPIYGFIARVLKIPKIDADKAYKSVLEYEAGDWGASNRPPKMTKKRSYLAWSLMITYAEVPSTFICGMISIFIVIPFLLLVRI